MHATRLESLHAALRHDASCCAGEAVPSSAQAGVTLTPVVVVHLEAGAAVRFVQLLVLTARVRFGQRP